MSLSMSIGFPGYGYGVWISIGLERMGHGNSIQGCVFRNVKL